MLPSAAETATASWMRQYSSAHDLLGRFQPTRLRLHRQPGVCRESLRSAKTAVPVGRQRPLWPPRAPLPLLFRARRRWPAWTATCSAGIRRPEPDGRQSALPASNEHVAWGVFLGDLVPRTNGSPREYANLGFWVAGRPVDFTTLQTLTGVATYTGGMIGNAVDQGRLRTVAGEFAHTFDFARRQGTMNANFDSAGFGVGTSINGATNVYAGSAPGTLNRTMAVQGAFFHNPAVGGAVSSGNLPRATGGVFGITGAGYGANGVFVGNRP